MKKIKTYYKALFLLVFLVACTEDDLRELSYLDTIAVPTNLAVAFNITQDNTGLVTITPSGDGAVSYDISFGDSSTEPANVVQGNGVEHTYGEGTYEIGVIAYNLNGDSVAVTQELIVSFQAPQNLVVTLENDAAITKQVNVSATADFAAMYEFYSGEVGVTQPVETANIGDVISYTYAEPGIYSVKIIAMGGAIATTEHTEEFEVTEILAPVTSAESPLKSPEDVISIYSSVYTDVAATDTFPDWGQGGQGSSWGTFDLAGDSMLQYTNLSYQGVQFGSAQDLTSMEFVHMDVWTADLPQLETSLISLTNGEKPIVSDLTLNDWTSIDIPLSAFTDQGLTIADIHQFKFVGIPWATGTVFIDNIYFYKSPTIATAPSISASNPTYPSGDVISIFSDTYTDIGISELNPNWGQTTTLTPLDISGNNIWLYESLNFSGIVTDYGNPTDLSGMDYVHFDYFTPDATVLGLKIVNTVLGQEDIEFVQNIIKGTWASVTIPLSDFDIDASGVAQLIFDTSGGSAKVYIDNFYFYSEVGSLPTVNAPIPSIDANNVISIFSDSYTSVGISELNPNWGQTTTLADFNISGNNIWQYDLLNFSGIVTDYGNPTDLSSMKYVHFDYWTPDATVLGLKIVNTVLGQEDLKFVEPVVTGTWVSVTIPLSDYAMDVSGVTQLIFDTTGGSSTVYIDNFYFFN
jgi:hypothetical protein